MNIRLSVRLLTDGPGLLADFLVENLEQGLN